jgi:multidrug efflux pump subunit AcrB
VAANVLDPLSRVPGVGELTLFGSQYAMRIWLDPNKLINYKLTPGDVAAAIRAQNAQIAAGQLGGLPAIPGQRLNATISAQGRLQTPAQFEAIVLRTGPSGATVRLRDVARVELGAKTTTPFRSTTATVFRSGRASRHRCECAVDGRWSAKVAELRVSSRPASSR